MSTPRQTVHNSDFEAVVMRMWEADIRDMVARDGPCFRVVTKCPACASLQHEGRFNVYGLEHVACRDCGALFISPCPPEEVVRRFYDEAESLRYWREQMPAAVVDSRKKHLYTSRAMFLREQLRQHRPEARRLIEIGGGNGEMAEKVLAHTDITEVILIEPQPLELNLPGCRVVQSTLEAYDGNGDADVVIAFEVLEHITEPARFVAKIQQLLAPGGVFIFSTPNIDGLELSVLGSLSTTIMFDHVCIHTPRSLMALLHRSGFEVVDLQTPGEFDVQSVRHQYEKGVLDLSSNPALKFVLEEVREDDRFQAFLRAQRQSSHVKCVARKPAA